MAAGFLRNFLPAICAACLAGPALSQEEVKARGVNPADNDTRADVIFKYNWLSGKSGIFTTTLKFDYRITREFGFNLEVPGLGAFRMSAPAPGVAGIHDTGVGDVFTRLRYIHSLGTSAFGHTSVGAGLEAVLPTASEKTLGSGAYQGNISVLMVQAWSPTLITAVIAKSTNSVHEFNGRREIQENTARIVQAFVLPKGMFVTLDGKYNWETINRRDVWWEGQVEFGMMVDAQTAASLASSRKWGDREDRGAVAATFKRFFL